MRPLRVCLGLLVLAATGPSAASLAAAQEPVPVDCAHPPGTLALPTFGAGQGEISTLRAQYGHPMCDAAGDSITAAVDWGDGTSGPAEVVPVDGAVPARWEIVATHRYARPGVFNAVIWTRNGRTGVSRADGLHRAQINATGTVSVRPALRARIGERFDGEAARIDIATGMWPSRQGYVAMVDWGDGTVSRGRITRLRATGLTVMGRHTWRGATRRRTLTVTVTTPGMSGTLTARRTVVLTRQ